MRYGMVIDLKKCVGCNACSVACKAENIPEKEYWWHKVFEIEKGKFPHVTKHYLPRPCFHCKNPACVTVCPSNASYRCEKTGLVLLKREKCIGCKYCMVACPYGVRIYDDEEGVVTKCTFCYQRLEKYNVPACVKTCIGNARYFGDLDDPNSEVSKLIARKRASVLLPEQGTEPSVYYIPP